MAEKRGSSVSSLRVDVDHFHFNWKFVGFNRIPFIAEHPIPSPSFSLNDNSETLWQLVMAKEMRSKLKPKEDIFIFEKTGGVETITETSDAEPDEKAVGFTLMKTESDECQTWETVEYFVQIKVGDCAFKTEEKVENGEKYFTTDSFQYIFSSDLKGVNLFDEETITIEAFIKHKQMDCLPLIPATMVNRESFTENLTRLFENQKYADVILKAGDCEIAAHKSILSTRAYGFEHHFLEDPDLSLQELDLDLDESVAEALLIYAYCGRIPEDFPVEKCPALYAAAEKYEASELKILVRDYFKTDVNSVLCLSCILDGESVPEMFLRLPEETVKAILEKKCSHKPPE